ncbi:hypothetical protein RJ639_042600 [Escallonia herrerae]|uniref:Uncharacterized protein n=1 Tax=Escallonia herrerae TaxID=1293975 RepID=A0AA88WRJ7_9ASTE|nr:hypothetical protein RJ639_042600 [Escallonia herrerae]
MEEPFVGSFHAKEIMLEKIDAFVPNGGCLNYIKENDEVLIPGYGERGMLLEIFLGLKIQSLKVSSASLLVFFKEKKETPGSKAKWRNFTKGI